MKHRILSVMLTLCLIVSLFAGFTAQAANEIITTPTGYTKAEDVTYKTVNGYIANWGARGEDCTFLSTYALDFYEGNYSYEILSKKAGGTSTSNAPSSALYQALKSMMSAKHSHQTSYKETRDLYCYTDCLRNDYKHISSFYSGKELNGAWDSGKTWNREHTWPNSKGMGGNDENDIMMLRPTWVQENSERGNVAYGESSKYFDPGEAVRGDCARIVLYVYTRWGNTTYMWGESGVIESLDILLKWMEEDPVDTWEMGRNDAVQSITGTRNVFVDYPEYAWLLFGEEIPTDMVTPSGTGSSVCEHTDTYQDISNPTCEDAGVITVYCLYCNEVISTETTPALGHDYAVTTIEPTCSAKGYDLYKCTRCGDEYQKNYTDTLEHKDDDGNKLCDNCGEALPCDHAETYDVTTDPTCTSAGKVETYCSACGEFITADAIAPLGHDYVKTTVEPTCNAKGYDLYKCSRCDDEYKRNYTNTVKHKDDDNDNACDFCGEEMVPPECPCELYDDITPEAWYHDYAVYVIENGLMNGISATRFDPSGCLTRAMLVTIIYRSEGSPDVSGLNNPFTDIPAGQWYTDAVIWAASNGIVNGMSATTYAPDLFISREQIATILYRYAQFKGRDVTVSNPDAINTFPDANEVSGYAINAITWAVDCGIINGIYGTLSAQALATRAEAATMLMRYLQ